MRSKERSGFRGSSRGSSTARRGRSSGRPPSKRGLPTCFPVPAWRETCCPFPVPVPRADLRSRHRLRAIGPMFGILARRQLFAGRRAYARDRRWKPDFVPTTLRDGARRGSGHGGGRAGRLGAPPIRLAAGGDTEGGAGAERGCSCHADRPGPRCRHGRSGTCIGSSPAPRSRLATPEVRAGSSRPAVLVQPGHGPLPRRRRPRLQDPSSPPAARAGTRTTGDRSTARRPPRTGTATRCTGSTATGASSPTSSPATASFVAEAWADTPERLAAHVRGGRPAHRLQLRLPDVELGRRRTARRSIDELPRARSARWALRPPGSCPTTM